MYSAPVSHSLVSIYPLSTPEIKKNHKVYLIISQNTRGKSFPEIDW